MEESRLANRARQVGVVDLGPSSPGAPNLLSSIRGFEAQMIDRGKSRFRQDMAIMDNSTGASRANSTEANRANSIRERPAGLTVLAGFIFEKLLHLW